MASYLQPYSSNLTIKEKQEIFSIRNSMVNECKILNEEQPRVKYEEIYSENIGKIKILYERYKENMERREELKIEKSHLTNGPPFIVNPIVNGDG